MAFVLDCGLLCMILMTLVSMMVGFIWLLWDLLDDHAPLDMIFWRTFHDDVMHYMYDECWVKWWLDMLLDNLWHLLDLRRCTLELERCLYSLMCHLEGISPKHLDDAPFWGCQGLDGPHCPWWWCTSLERLWSPYPPWHHPRSLGCCTHEDGVMLEWDMTFAWADLAHGWSVGTWLMMRCELIDEGFWILMMLCTFWGWMWLLEFLCPLRRWNHPLFGFYTHTCGLLRGRFDVLAFYLYFGCYFGGWSKTYPPCIMDYYVFRGF